MGYRVSCTQIIVLALFSCLTITSASAHPVTEGRIRVECSASAIRLDTTASLEQVSVWDAMRADNSAGADEEQVLAAHAHYLGTKFRVKALGQDMALAGTAAVGRSSNIEYRDFILTFASPGAAACEPGGIQIYQDVLREFEYAPGNPWESFFVASTTTGGEMVLVKSATWTPLTPHAGLGVARDFFVHGLEHILTGYDHLLFVGALVLGAVSLSRAVIAISAFTLAHTVTLILSVLGFIRLPSEIVEPVIAFSIVAAAAANIFRGERTEGDSLGRSQAVHIGLVLLFGLFHGLGFAGGLRDLLAEGSAALLVPAFTGFALGVETGHMIVVMIIIGVLRAVDSLSLSFPILNGTVRRVASWAVALLGVMYCVRALEWAA